MSALLPALQLLVSMWMVSSPALSPTERLFDPEVSPRLVELEVAPADLVWLQDHATMELSVPATVRLDGEVFTNAGLRYKGSFGSLFSCFDGAGNQVCPKLSMQVGFNTFVPGGRMFGVRKLVLQSCSRDPTCLRERLAYHTFREAGLVASRAVHVTVSVNGGAPSVYLLVEKVDEEYVEDHFEHASGSLYKEVWPQHLVAGPYVNALRTNEDSPNVGRLVELATLLSAEPGDAELGSIAEAWFDVDAVARYLAVHQLVHNWDGVTKVYCSGETCQNHNFYLYDDPGSGRVALLPWDLDNTFDRPDRDLGRAWHDDGPDACVIHLANAFVGQRAPQCDPLLRAFLVLGWDRYRAAMSELVSGSGPGHPQTQLAALATWRAELLPHIAADPLGPGLEAWRRDVARLRQIIREQHLEALTLLAEQ